LFDSCRDRYRQLLSLFDTLQQQLVISLEHWVGFRLWLTAEKKPAAGLAGVVDDWVRPVGAGFVAGVAGLEVGGAGIGYAGRGNLFAVLVQAVQCWQVVGLLNGSPPTGDNLFGAKFRQHAQPQLFRHGQ